MKPRKPFSLAHERDSRILRAFDSLASIGFQVVHAEPDKPRKPRAPRHGLTIAAEHHATLRDMAARSDWQERGGRAIREAGQYQTGGKVIGRTVWVGKPEWARSIGLNTAGIIGAVEKAIAGDHLGKRQALCIAVMLAEIRGETIGEAAPEETPF